MDFIKENNRVYLKDLNGEIIAYVTFPEENGVCVIDHTVVSPTLRGQGVAGKLLMNAYEVIKERGMKCKPVCSYAVGWFEKNPDKRDILI